MNSNIVSGQQILQSGLYMFEPFLYNPAYSGMTNSLSLTAAVRKQWNGFPGAPAYQFVSAHLPIYNLRSGAGLLIDNQTLGAHRLTNGRASYSYIFEGLGNGILSAGIGLGLINHFVQGDLLRAPDGEYENTINHNDPILSNETDPYSAMTLSGGILYRNNTFETGLSMLQALNIGLSSKNGYRPVRHIMVNGSYYYKLSEEVRLVPSVLLKYDFNILQLDTDFQLYFKNFIFGIGSRGYSRHSFDAYKLNISGRVMENILVGYLYEGTLSQLKSYNDNTHELFIQYRLPIKLLKKHQNVIYHPRM